MSALLVALLALAAFELVAAFILGRLVKRLRSSECDYPVRREP